jgi:hypothetical protein
MNSNRRQFIKAGAAIATASFIPWTRKALANVSKNDRPRIGCIGLGGMGTGDAEQHAHFGDILAVCDVDRRHAEKAKDSAKIGKGKADLYGDYRKVLDREDIDVVSVVTPDHWHVKIAIEALQAGKHVFCQKPLTLTLEENQLIRKACHAYPNLVFFVGTQQRSDRDRFFACDQHGAEGAARKNSARQGRYRRFADGRAVSSCPTAKRVGLEYVARASAASGLPREALP